MRVVLQRVNRASVSIENELVANIKRGYLLLVGIGDEDSEVEIDYVANKISKLRIFEDENQKMNLSLQQVDGEILSVSQFTLYADTKKGNRPNFTNAAKPDIASELYDRFNELLRKHGFKVVTGKFGADMQVALENDGPVTILFDTDNK